MIDRRRVAGHGRAHFYISRHLDLLLATINSAVVTAIEVLVRDRYPAAL
jgi:hypothetical protein